MDGRGLADGFASFILAAMIASAVLGIVAWEAMKFIIRHVDIVFHWVS